MYARCMLAVGAGPNRPHCVCASSVSIVTLLGVSTVKLSLAWAGAATVMTGTEMLRASASACGRSVRPQQRDCAACVREHACWLCH